MVLVLWLLLVLVVVWVVVLGRVVVGWHGPEARGDEEAAAGRA